MTMTLREALEQSGAVDEIIEAEISDAGTLTLSESLQTSVSDAIQDAVTGYLSSVWAQIRIDIIETSYFVVLVGGVICIILYVAGWDKGMKYLGIGFVAHILIRAILG